MTDVSWPTPRVGPSAGSCRRAGPAGMWTCGFSCPRRRGAVFGCKVARRGGSSWRRPSRGRPITFGSRPDQETPAWPRFPPPGTRLHNAFNGETFIFTHLEEDPDEARLDVHLARGGMLTGTGRQHVHPNSDEAFTVRSGRLRVMVDGAWREVGPGETLVVPRGTPHLFRNGHDGGTLFTARFRPAHDHLRFFLNMGTNTAKRPEWYDAGGEPPLALRALALHAYRGHAYAHGIPAWFQRLLFALLAPVALARGYKLAVPPRRRRQTGPSACWTQTGQVCRPARRRP